MKVKNKNSFLFRFAFIFIVDRIARCAPHTSLISAIPSNEAFHTYTHTIASRLQSVPCFGVAPCIYVRLALIKFVIFLSFVSFFYGFHRRRRRRALN